MIHDTARVAALRKGIRARLDLIASLEGRIVKGKLPWLEVARNQTQDVETVLLRSLEQEDRTPAEEARSLSFAEHMLQLWDPQLKQTQEQFSQYGSREIEIVGG